jgi:hypothetical protein
MPNLVGWMKISFIPVLSCIVRRGVSEEDILCVICRLGSAVGFMFGGSKG